MIWNGSEIDKEWVWTEAISLVHIKEQRIPDRDQ